MSLALAVARRALLLALVSLLVAVVALVAAFVVDSGSDTAGTVDSEQPGADVAAAQEAVDVATAMAEASAASTAAAQEAAAAAQEATAAAQEAAAIAQDAAALADAALARAAAAEAALVAALAEAGTAAGSESAAGAESQPAEAQQDAAPAETGTEAESTAEEEAASSDTSTEDPDATGESTDGTEPEDATGDGSEQETVDAEASLPGEPFEFGPPEGAGLAVVGVSHDSVLNVRDVPAGEIIARLDNVMNVGSEPVVYVREADSDDLIATLDLNRGVIATGNTRQLPTTIWHEIRMADAVGWASSSFLSPLGATLDFTRSVFMDLGEGEAPSAPTLDALGRLVATVPASEDASRIVVSGAPVVGDLGEITVDMLGVPDDAVRGFRFHVFAHQDPDSGSFVLKSVEATLICYSHRGVNEDGDCN